jgi:hypothetical protein
MTRTLDDLIWESQEQIKQKLEHEKRPPRPRPAPPMQTYENGAPRWIFWFFLVLFAVTVIACIAAGIRAT